MRFLFVLWALVVFCPLALAGGVASSVDDGALALAMVQSSPTVRAAQQALAAAVADLPADLRDKTQAAMLTAGGCIAYRAGADATVRQQVVSDLIRQGFARDEKALYRSLYGYPVTVGTDCTRRTAAALAAPGGDDTGHHVWPGGLMVHTAFNLAVARDLVRRYREASGEPAALDAPALTAAVLWHDWAKQLEYVWADGHVQSYETALAGTGAHHIIALAEAMASGLPARVIAAQACAHGVPETVGPQGVADWLRAAAIVARVDPVARGYLHHVSGGYAADFGPECRISYLSDQNWVYAEPALQHARARLQRLAPRFADGDTGLHYRHFTLWALSYYGADRLDLATDSEALPLLQSLPPLPDAETP